MHDIRLFNYLIPILFFLFAIKLYLYAVIKTNQRFRQWPFYRSLNWTLGMLFCSIALFGAMASNISFVDHMISHLLLGMLSPLLIALSSPLTLLVRWLSVRKARILMRIMRSRLFQLFQHPIVTSLLNIGGLWLLYGAYRPSKESGQGCLCIMAAI